MTSGCRRSAGRSSRPRPRPSPICLGMPSASAWAGSSTASSKPPAQGSDRRHADGGDAGSAPIWRIWPRYSPTPGGGAWAAVSAAAGASLIAMVARLTIKKKGFEHVLERMRAIADECDDERWALLALADRDAEAYQAVMAAYKLPSGWPLTTSVRGLRRCSPRWSAPRTSRSRWPAAPCT